MIWTSIAVSLLCIGPVAWLFYKGYALENKLKKELKALEQKNGWSFDQTELNGQRICGIDSKQLVMAMVWLAKNEVKITHTFLFGVKELKYATGGVNEEEEPCELLVKNEDSSSKFVFYQPSIDNALKFRDLELFGKRWFNKAQEVAVKMDKAAKPAFSAKLSRAV